MVTGAVDVGGGANGNDGQRFECENGGGEMCRGGDGDGCGLDEDKYAATLVGRDICLYSSRGIAR